VKKTSWAILAVVIVVVVTLLADRVWLKNYKVPAAAGSAKAGGRAKPGEMPNAPQVTFKDLQGNAVPLAQFKGKVVLVNFWATWCEPCRIEIPSLIEFQQKYAARGFTILGVAMDDEGASVVQPFVEKPQWDVDGKKVAMNYPIMLGNDDVAAKFGGLLGIPTSVLISRDGKVVKRIIGLISTDSLEREIQSLL
jgi:thiol-disulfide isomerase/thioredoxin